VTGPSCDSGIGSLLMLGETLPESYSSTNSPMLFSVISLVWSNGNFSFLTVSWIAKAGHLPTSRLRLLACCPKALASMVAKLILPLYLTASGLSSLARVVLSSSVSAKI
jgi:hypothetical protein